MNDDALFLILSEVARRNGTIVSVSSVSQRLRQLSLPLLFRRCTTSLTEHKGPPPSVIWPYIQTLTFRGTYYLPVDVSTFPNGLQHLPYLHTIRFDNLFYIPWSAVMKCFSAPGLSTLEFVHSVVGEYDATALPFPSSLPVTRIIYTFRDWVETAKVFELDGPRSLLKLARHSIESLTIPPPNRSELLMTLPSFPRLRELTIQSFRPVSEDLDAFLRSLSPIIARLRTLKVKVALPFDGTRIRLWTTGSSPNTTFQQMEDLEICYADPADGIFGRLTDRLRRLSLRDYPRYYFVIDPFDRNFLKSWTAPILSSSECLQILKKCPLGLLEDLEIVYKSDDSDADLLQHIAAHCSNLRRLEIHRYRSNEGDDVDTDRWVQILAPLRLICVLRLHLDLPDSPHPHGGSYCDPYHRRLMDIATSAAAGLSPTLQRISILLRMHSGNFWLTWYIHRDPLLRLEFSKDWSWNTALMYVITI
ncbi:hypothetical protein OF83DRAFT_1129782 [Amylostereum chailletii]|nr:hypothetical protein OF83DRAFT_1129782 [Amylostereum chailletii]